MLATGRPRTPTKCERFGTDSQISCRLKLCSFTWNAPRSPAESPHAQEFDREIGSTIKPKRNSDRRKANLLGGFYEASIPGDVVPALMLATGFAQTPAASGNTDQINIQGCLGGSDGNYTVAEEKTGKIFKITTSNADFRAYLGQEVDSRRTKSVLLRTASPSSN
jgi:hypothetical protein